MIPDDRAMTETIRDPVCIGARGTSARLNEELKAVRAAGHVLGPWGPADPDLVEELDLLDSARQCACVCELMVVAGWDASGEFVTARIVSGLYDRDADERAVDADLAVKWHGPCPAAMARADFHNSRGYKGLAEAFND
jgi:hypothetical protein